ncbi:hypothetical protein J3F83DRAFT_706983 [Trichoderma novae-zelandiae]
MVQTQASLGGTDAACLYEHEHALLHRRHASAGPMHRKPSGRHTLAFVAGCELLAPLRASSGDAPATANGVTGSPSDGGTLAMHQLVIRWMLLDGRRRGLGLERHAAAEAGKQHEAACAQFMPDTLASAGGAACVAVLQCCREAQRLLLGDSLPSWPFSLLLPPLHPMHWAATGVGDRCPATLPDFEVACYALSPPRPDLNYRVHPATPTFRFDLLRPNLSDLVWLSSTLSGTATAG